MPSFTIMIAEHKEEGDKGSDPAKKRALLKILAQERLIVLHR
jgi:hypothetical protein